MPFEKLLSPVSIGGVQLKNRMVMAPMGTGFCTREGFVTQQLKDYYEARAKGGIALARVGVGCVSYPKGLSIARQVGLYDDRLIPGLKELVDVIHKHDCRVVFQLHHAGHRATRSITGYQPVSASEVPDKERWTRLGGEPPRALTTYEVEELVEAHVAAAARVKEAGADGVEIHGAHGYLLMNFLSPLYNKRTDKYGGDLPGRAAFPREIVESIRRRLGKEFLIIFRISAEEGVNGGLVLEQSKAMCSILERAGVDAFDVTSGGFDSYSEVVPPMDFAPGWRVHMAAAIKQVVTVPVITTGRIQDPALAESILEEGKADLIGLGRALICDPEFPNKIMQQRTSDIRWCIACNQGCIDRLRMLDLEERSYLTCFYNPEVGHEVEGAIRPAEAKKDVIVIGGGPSGMEAALVAASRGHKVTLFEKQGELGGQFRLATIPPHKGELVNVTKYFESQILKARVNLKLGQRVTAEMIEELNPDAVILATGGLPIVPALPGAEQGNVMTAWDVLRGGYTGSNVVVVGGGMVGCETADFLAQMGRKVTVVEQLPAIAQGLGVIRRSVLLNRLANQDVKLKSNTVVREIVQGGVITGDGQHIVADTVVLALGVWANRELESSLRGRRWELYCVGDCDTPGNAMTAIHRAFYVARQL